jgi:hypothetical protein
VTQSHEERAQEEEKEKGEVANAKEEERRQAEVARRVAGTFAPYAAPPSDKALRESLRVIGRKVTSAREIGSGRESDGETEGRRSQREREQAQRTRRITSRLLPTMSRRLVAKIWSKRKSLGESLEGWVSGRERIASQRQNGQAEITGRVPRTLLPTMSCRLVTKLWVSRRKQAKEEAEVTRRVTRRVTLHDRSPSGEGLDQWTRKKSKRKSLRESLAGCSLLFPAA